MIYSKSMLQLVMPGQVIESYFFIRAIINMDSLKDFLHKLAKGESVEHEYIRISITSLTPHFVRPCVEGEGV